MISSTISAAEKLKSLIVKENPDIKLPTTYGLRLDITKPPGRLSLESEPKEDDLVEELRGLRFFLSPANQEIASTKYHKSILICWIEGSSEGFTIQNPNTRSGCDKETIFS